MAKFNWVDFYERLGGRRLLNAAKAQMRSVYDYVLIDSRTGVSDTSGICTAEMPDTLVICFTLNQQSIIGASAVASSVAAIRNIVKGGSGKDGNAVAADPLRILPVPTRVEITSERDKLRTGLEVARQTFSQYLDIPREAHAKYWGSIQMAYFPFYAFEEIPSVFGDSPNQLLSLSTAIKQLTAAITNNEITDYPPLAEREEDAERVRRAIVGWYLRHSSEAGADAALLAQEIFERVPSKEQEPTLSALARLIQIGEGSALSPKSARLEDFGQRHALLTPFVQAKLVTITETATGRTVAFAEAVIVEKWKTLRDWSDRHRQFLIVRQTVGAAMQSWKLANHDESLLLRGRSLLEAQEGADSTPNDLSDEEHQFIDLSLIEEPTIEQGTETAPRMIRWVTMFGWRHIAPVVVLLIAGIAMGGYQIWSNRSETYFRVLGSEIINIGEEKIPVLNIAAVNDGDRSAFIRRVTLVSTKLGIDVTPMEFVVSSQVAIPPSTTTMVRLAVPVFNSSRTREQLLASLRTGKVQIMVDVEETKPFGGRVVRTQIDEADGRLIFSLLPSNEAIHVPREPD